MFYFPAMRKPSDREMLETEENISTISAAAEAKQRGIKGTMPEASSDHDNNHKSSDPDDSLCVLSPTRDMISSPCRLSDDADEISVKLFSLSCSPSSTSDLDNSFCHCSGSIHRGESSAKCPSSSSPNNLFDLGNNSCQNSDSGDKVESSVKFSSYSSLNSMADLGNNSCRCSGSSDFDESSVKLPLLSSLNITSDLGNNSCHFSGSNESSVKLSSSLNSMADLARNSCDSPSSSDTDGGSVKLLSSSSCHSNTPELGNSSFRSCASSSGTPYCSPCSSGTPFFSPCSSGTLYYSPNSTGTLYVSPFGSSSPFTDSSVGSSCSCSFITSLSSRECCSHDSTYNHEADVCSALHSTAYKSGSIYPKESSFTRSENITSKDNAVKYKKKEYGSSPKPKKKRAQKQWTL